jgi:predicted metal-dependent phosphoesterase TrpH
VADAAGPARTLRVDMHCHTRLSFDSLSAYEGVLATARARGIDRLCVTDHNEVDAALRLHAEDPELVMVGEEVKTAEGADIIGIFLTERIPKRTPARETCERIRAQGGVVYMPHPFDTRRSGGAALLDELEELVDVVEAHNSRTWRPELNRRGEEWALAHGKPLGAGSDAHTLREIGRGFVEVPHFEPNRDSFLVALRAGRVAGRECSSPFCSLFSTYAKIHKLFAGKG